MTNDWLAEFPEYTKSSYFVRQGNQGQNQTRGYDKVTEYHLFRAMSEARLNDFLKGN